MLQSLQDSSAYQESTWSAAYLGDSMVYNTICQNENSKSAPSVPSTGAFRPFMDVQNSKPLDADKNQSVEGRRDALWRSFQQSVGNPPLI
jgi:hypothetical protein